jgi:hypothetical protein
MQEEGTGAQLQVQHGDGLTGAQTLEWRQFRSAVCCV